MSLIFHIKLYLMTAVVFFAIDMFWLGFAARDFYQVNLGRWLSPDVNWIAAGVFYAIYIAGLLFFAISPALAEGSVAKAILYGALFGFFTYATYDLTNMATIADWPLKVVVVDILWGVILGASVSLAGFYAGKWIG